MVKHLEDKEDLQHLLEELKSEIDKAPRPTILRAYGTVRALLSGKASEDIYVDEWPSWNMLIATPSRRPNQDHVPKLIPSVSICTRNKAIDNTRSVLNAAVQWNKPCIFTGVSKDLAETIESSFKDHGTFTKLMDCETMVNTNEDILGQPTPVPESYRLTTVMPSMAEEVASHWRQSREGQTTNGSDETSVQLVEYNSMHFPSSCVIDKTYKPIAHALCHYYGAIGMLGLSKPHKGQGLSAIALHDLCRKLHSSGEPIWAHIEKENLAAAELFCRTGFTVLKNSTTSWLAYSPEKLESAA